MTKKTIATQARRTKKAASRPVKAEIQRAAERTGIRPLPVIPSIDEIPRLRSERKHIGERIAHISDLVAKRVALSDDPEPLLEIHRELWRMRCELGALALDTSGGGR